MSQPSDATVSVPSKRTGTSEDDTQSPKRVKFDSEEQTSPSPSAAPAATPDLGSAAPTAAAPPQAKSKRDSSRRDAAGWAKSRKGKEKDTKNPGRRRGTRGDGEGRDAGEEPADKGQRLPKRQCALLIGFCGTGCAGMQIQPDVRTIEGVLFDALVRAGAVSQDNADDSVKVNLGRAARTDAGVHAAGNVVSMKVITQIPGVPDLVARVNELLPPEIRLWGYVRVQNSFNARLSCDSRKYTYFFPSYLLIPPKPGSGLHTTVHSQPPPSTEGAALRDAPSHSFWAEAGVHSKEDEMARKRRWRATSDMMKRLRETAKKFEGTRNFHNFTVGREFSDRSTQRHMKKIEVADPAVYGSTEWISVLFHGQSFMLHQIVSRKMMAALILSSRTGTPPQVIDELYGPRQVFIPKMPSLGLLLEHPIFESYNRKVAGVNGKLTPEDADFRPPIDFEIHQNKIDDFKQEQIYSRMRDIEDRGDVFDAWVRSVDAYSGSDLLYLNPRGIIPAAAVIKKGTRRGNPFREKRRFDVTDYSAAGKIEEHDDEEEEQEVVIDKSKLADMEG
ncbi:pseudouridine synthase [Artomyces pyxidatus]|uniref:Pseudouridine synthase n=1 Tax=Artomyces pyxidatus TaxID=48021 RepID=A0ACB8T7R5_9AGAM|nr:pseudouridine synthase [Artomyces pyxidatus]